MKYWTGFLTAGIIGAITWALQRLAEHFGTVCVLLDCYTVFAAKASKYKNPINEVGVTKVYGLDDPRELEKGTGLRFVAEREMTPPDMIAQLRGTEKSIFQRIYAGTTARKMYRMYEFERSNQT